MHDLLWNFKLLNHPYKYEGRWSNEVWCRICLKVKSNSQDIILLQHDWNVIEVFNWYCQSREFLLKEEFPFEIKGSSIAESRSMLFDKEDFRSEQEEESYYSKLEAYFHNHSFKLRGTPTPMFYIGLKNSIGDISYYHQASCEYRVYHFDMNQFVEHSDLAIKNLSSSILQLSDIDETVKLYLKSDCLIL